jgi:exosortase/archaeosortase family protein
MVNLLKREVSPLSSTTDITPDTVRDAELARVTEALGSAVIDSLVKLGEGFLQLLNFETTSYSDGRFRQHFGVSGSAGVTIGAPCDGIVLFALFIVFMISYPGPMRHKLWYMPVGLVLIHGLNVLRVAGLALIVHYNEKWFSFNHDYTFTLIVYAAVFGLWWLWIAKFSRIRKAATT